MNEMTKFERTLAVNIAVRLVLIMLLGVMFHFVLGGSIYTTFTPCLPAGGATVQSGIQAFNGQAQPSQWIWYNNIALGSLFVYYVLLPWLFIKSLTGWINIAKDDRTLHTARTALWSHILTAGLIGMMCFGSWDMFRSGKDSEQSVVERNKLEAKNSLFIERLNCIALQAQNYFFLPAQNGGGGRTFQPIRLPDGSTRQFTISEVPFKKSLLPGRKRGLLHMNDVAGKYFIEPLAVDTVITIRAISNIPSANKEFVNSDGSKGNNEWILTVYPHNHSYRQINP